MPELLALYAWTIVAVAITGGALALIGSQISARHSAIKSLVISQSSALGVVVAIASQPLLKPYLQDFAAHPAVNYVVGFVVTLFVYGICTLVLGQRHAAKNTFYIGVFAVLTALTYLMTALTPTLESHVVASFFGDPTFISPEEAQGISVLALNVLVFTLVFWRSISAWSFQVATFSRPPISPQLGRVQVAFNICSLLLLYSSVLLMGLLFTLSALLLPVILLAGATHHNRLFKALIVPVAAIGCGGGFMFSLWQGTLPTTPCITLALVVTGGSAALVLALLSRMGSGLGAGSSSFSQGLADDVPSGDGQNPGNHKAEVIG